MSIFNQKFQRNYYLQIEGQDFSTIVIQPPFTIEFDITRNILSSANISTIRIYNLSLTNRNNIDFNLFNQSIFRSIELQAGYGWNMSTIFKGNITQAFSVRDGNNYITQIEGFDGGYAINNAQTNLQFPAGTPNQLIIETLASSLFQYNVTLGQVGIYAGTALRGNSYMGPTLPLLAQLTGGGAFIDNQQINCLGNTSCLFGTDLLINSSTGLLGTPVRERNRIIFDILFEPGIIVGQLLTLQSSTSITSTLTNPTQGVNGLYKVVAVKHRGTISESVCGDAVTTLTLLSGPGALSII